MTTIKTADFRQDRLRPLLLSVLLLGLTGASRADSDICYAVADSVDQLVQMDRVPVPNTTFNDIGDTGTSNIESIALYLDGTTIYAANANRLGTLNTSNGNFTAVSGSTFGTGSGALGSITFSDVDGLAFDALTGFFYGTHRRSGNTDVLFRIDRSTGTYVADAFGTGIDYVEIDTSVLGGSLDDIDDIGIDPNDGQMYAVANNGGAADHLIRIDKLTGAVTDVAIFNDGSNNVNDVEGLGFYNDGRFYAVTGNGSNVSDTFFDVDLSNAQMRNILAFPSYSDYEAVACLTGGPNHITGTVFVDNDRDGIDNSGAYWPNIGLQLFLDVNGDGFVDSGDTLIQTTTTDVNGDYDFLTAATGPFVVRVDIATLPANNSFTTDNIETAVFPIPPSTSPTFGVTDPDNDFGIGTGINTITGTVFDDSSNGDGILDAGEAGESGVTVRLYEDNNNNGIVDAGDNWVGSVDSGADGSYSFNVGLGNFVVDIDDNDLPTGTYQTTNPPNFSQEADFSNPALGETDSSNDFGFALTYVVDSTCAPTFTDISGTGTLVVNTDDGEANVTLPFSFLFFDIRSSALRIGDNGGILFDATSGGLAYVNTAIPTNDPALAILPFWDDLNSGQSGAGVYVQTLGTPPNRRYVVQWNNIPHYNTIGRATIQAVLFEGSNDIQFIYPDVNFGNANYNNGASATIGLNRGLGVAQQYSYNTASLSGVSGICYFSANDYGDAPSGYGDALHNIPTTIDVFLGGTGGAPDREGGTQSTAGADGDNEQGQDDEAAVTFRSPAGTGQSIFADVIVTNSSGGAATLCGWLDEPPVGPPPLGAPFVAGDGRCVEVNAGNCTDLGSDRFECTLQWSGMPTDQQYSTYARFRVSSDALTTADSSGNALDGEVEDYRIVFDFTPTAVTIGDVDLEAAPVTDFLDGVGVGRMDGAALLALLEAWDPLLAADLAGADAEILLQALREHLDPDGDGQVAVLGWETLEQRGTIGFFVERRQGDGEWILINDDMLPALVPAPMGGEYKLTDPNARAGIPYQYRLIEQEANGATRSYGPYSLEMPQ